MAGTLVFGANANLVGQPMELLTPNRGPVQSVPIVVEPSAYDHVVRAVTDLPAPVGGQYNLTAGSWAFAASVLLAGVIRVPPGVTCLLKGMGWDKAITRSGGTAVLQVDGVAVVETLSLAGATRAVCMNNASAELYMLYCSLDAASVCVGIDVALRLKCIGCRWQDATAGLSIDGNASILELDGVVTTGLTGNFLTYTAGTVDSCIIRGCQSVQTGGGTVAINWPAANIPTYGLLVVGNHFSFTAAPWNGHTPASARVNYKANSYWDGALGGLLTETAIVP